MSFDLIKDNVTLVTIRSNFSPEIQIDPFPETPGKSSQSPITRKILEIVQPQILVDTGFGPVSVSPGGVPTKNFFFVTVAVGIVITGLAIFGAYKLATS